MNVLTAMAIQLNRRLSGEMISDYRIKAETKWTRGVLKS